MEDRKVRLAREMATAAHKGQKRWGGEPYITHCEAVADRMKTTEEKIAGWLHDTVEDTDTTLTDIANVFGPRITRYIDLLTHRKEDTYSEYILRVSELEVPRKVKMADLEHNLIGLDKVKQRQRIDKYELAYLYLATRQVLCAAIPDE